MHKKIIPIFLILCLFLILSACDITVTKEEGITLKTQTKSNERNTLPKPNGEWEKLLINCENKYFVVQHTAETYNSVDYEIGVVDANNNWIRPLSRNNILIGKKNLGYLGDGVVVASDGVEVQKEDGSSFTVGKINARGETSHFYNIEEDKSFSVKADVISTVIDDYIITSEVSRSCYRITDTGTEQIDFVAKLGPYSDGLFYGYPGGSFSKGYYFYDINGTPIIDMSEYDMELKDKRNIKFENGMCTFEFKNPSGNVYCATIDKSGNFIKEPYKK